MAGGCIDEVLLLGNGNGNEVYFLNPVLSVGEGQGEVITGGMVTREVLQISQEIFIKEGVLLVVDGPNHYANCQRHLGNL